MESSGFEAGVDYHKAYSELEESVSHLKAIAVGRPQMIDVSPTHVTIAWGAYKDAEQILKEHPHPRFMDDLTRLFLEFNSYREKAKAAIDREYPADNEHYQRMIQIGGDIDAAVEEALKSSIDHLVREQGVPRETVDALERQGFRHTTRIESCIPAQMEYEESLRATHSPDDIKIIPLSDGGKAYWVRGKTSELAPK